MSKINDLQVKVARKIESQHSYKIKDLKEYSRQGLLNLFKSCSKQINHIYWSQKNSALKVIKAKDRNCYILELENKPIGILVFKNLPLLEEQAISSEKGYIELKSFFLFDRFWEGHIWKLWDFLLNEINQNYPDIDWIYVSVSKKKAESSLHMFKKMGFSPLYESYNKYTKDGDIEVFLYCPIGSELHSHSRELTLSEPYFSQLQNGTKTVEWRTGKNFEQYKIWDIIIFKNRHRILKKTITNITKYSSLEDYLDQEGVNNCLPWENSKEKAIEIYNKIPWYKEKIKKYWIIAFKF